MRIPKPNLTGITCSELTNSITVHLTSFMSGAASLSDSQKSTLRENIDQMKAFI